MLHQPLRRPGKEAPVLEALEAVHDDHERTRPVGGVEFAADGQAFVGAKREVRQTLKRNRITSPS
jgi:hypothetical protein